MVIQGIKEVNDLTDIQKRWLRCYVRRNYGLRLTYRCERFFLSRLYKRGDNLEKLHVSKDLRVRPMLYFARDFAQRNKTGIFRKEL
jgi:hypothetical protein